MIVVTITNGNAILHRSIAGRYDLRLTDDSSAAAARFVGAFSTSGAGTTLATRRTLGAAVGDTTAGVVDLGFRAVREMRERTREKEGGREREREEGRGRERGRERAAREETWMSRAWGMRLGSPENMPYTSVQISRWCAFTMAVCAASG